MTHHHHHHKQPSHFMPKLAVAFLVGIVFGFSFERSGAYLPAGIYGMLSMSKLVTLKFFMSTLAVSMGIIALLSMFESTREFFNLRKASVVHRGLPAAAIGGSLLGLGMVLSGTPPGAMWMQVGLLSNIAPYAVAGAILGVLAFSLANPALQPLVTRGKTVAATLTDSFSLPFAPTALAMSLCCLLLGVALELLVPEEAESARLSLHALLNLHHARPWPPVIAGLLVGSVQLPLVLLIGTVHGSSTALVTLVGHAMHAIAPNALNRMQYLQQYRAPNNTWQVATVFGVALGALLSVHLSGQAAPVFAMSPLRVVVGSFLTVFGARLAGGCTCGHGISGSSFLASTALTTMGAAFGTGLLVTRLVPLL